MPHVTPKTGNAPTPAHDWRLGFHLMPPAATDGTSRPKVGDPNGLSYYNGLYHVFCQYSPDGVAPMGWGHFTSPDLITWTWHDSAITPDTPADSGGSYSGSAVAHGQTLRAYFTGNVKLPGNFDYINAGRKANQLLLTAPFTTDSPSTANFSAEKNLLLTNADYPDWCSCHVRDPKVWKQDGRWWMLLGARTTDNLGCVLLYGSDDGLTWLPEGSATTLEASSDQAFGYMWECPNLVSIDGHEFLLVCPQGLARTPFANQNLHNVGYFPLNGRLIDLMRAGGNPLHMSGPHPCLDASTYRELDFGFDFYAPQILTFPPSPQATLPAEKSLTSALPQLSQRTQLPDSTGELGGRTFMFGWVGEPDPDLQYATPTTTWENSLSIPRELSCNAAGRLCQVPASELESLRGQKLKLTSEGAATNPTRWLNSNSSPYPAFSQVNHIGTLVPSGLAELKLHDVAPNQTGHIMLNYDVELLITPNLIELAFTSQAGYGRTVRRLSTNTLSAGQVSSIHMLVDTSLIEVFLNNGEAVFTTRWFPQTTRDLQLTTDLQTSRIECWELQPHVLLGQH